MNNRFIEIDSTHRNRVEFPFQASFVAPFAPSSINVKDPVLDGAIYYTFSSSYQPTVFYPLKSGTTNSSPKLYVSNTVPQPSQFDYYAGYVILVSYTDSFGNTVTGMKTVTGYNPTDVSLSLDTAFSFNDNHNLQAGDLYSLFELNTPSLIHLPLIDSYSNKALSYAEAYNCYYIVDETLSYGTSIVARLIENYDAGLRYCYLQTPFPTGWTETDSYTIRRTLPLEKWILASPTVYNERGLLVFSLPPNANSNDGFYVGKYIYFSSNPSPSIENGQFTAIYGTYQIIEYNGFTRKATCYGMYDNTLNDTTPTLGNIINIVNVAYDNFSPLIYTGTRVSQNQTVCYEIALISIILPNVTLETGSRIAFYPYIYVELSNTSTPSGASQNLIYSNNPESSRALFIVAISDVVQPINSDFVKLLGRMRQVVKFKPNDSLRFRVYLPDGELFQPIKKDTFSPYRPDPSLQINALFSIKHL